MRLRPSLLVLPVLAVALLASGCFESKTVGHGLDADHDRRRHGRDRGQPAAATSSTPATSTSTTTSTASTTTATTRDEHAGGGTPDYPAAREGKFATTCGGCHTLADARHQGHGRSEPRPAEARRGDGRAPDRERRRADARRPAQGPGRQGRRGLRRRGRRQVASLSHASVLPPGFDPASVRAIATDLDGTILDGVTFRPSQRTIAAMRAAEAVRHPRHPRDRAHVPERAADRGTMLDVHSPIICYQGGLVADPDTGEVLLHTPARGRARARDPARARAARPHDERVRRRRAVRDRGERRGDALRRDRRRRDARRRRPRDAGSRGRRRSS